MFGGIGSIADLFPDKVGLLWSVKVKTVTVMLERPVAKLCLLLEADSEIWILV